MDDIRPRRAPWASPEGKPVYLVTEDDGKLARLADSMESAQLHDAAVVLDHSLSVLGNFDTPEAELRCVGERLAECLTNTLRVAQPGRTLTQGDGRGEAR
ncbi:hypothetical protein [Streptomyces sp. 8K308]|uniref:hypothetical protein n=1 Tax=Streptomyces sp. 8K308 TaxID=2530388 RepID=UPI001FB76F76|nr:hypothetical protein [Streptomyces sp. 8K308]